MSEDIKKDFENENIDASGAVDPGATRPISDVEATAVMDALAEPDTGGLDVLADGSAVDPDEVGAAAGIDAAAETAPIEGAASKKKGIIAAIVAVAIVAVVGIGAALAMQPSSSGAGDPSGSSASVAATSASSASSGSSGSAASSKSSASSRSSAAAASSGSATTSSSGSAEKAEGSSGSSATAAGSGNTAASSATSGGGTTSGTTGSTGSSTSRGNASSTTNNSTNTGTTSGGNAATPTPAHTHNWVPITEPRTVIDQEEWDEPVYVEESHFDCSICGDVGNVNGGDHLEEAHPNEYASGGYFPVRIQVDTIHHAAVTHDETVTVGYRCSECGATK